jgi:hypothetical protein
MKNRFLSTVLCVALAACGGREAMPTTSYKYGDEQLNCSELRAEAAQSEREILKLYAEKKDASGDNVAIGVLGGLLFWPALFALDTTDSEKIEIHAHKERLETLQRIMANKKCGRYESKIEEYEAEQKKREQKQKPPTAD